VDAVIVEYDDQIQVSNTLATVGIELLIVGKPVVSGEDSCSVISSTDRDRTRQVYPPMARGQEAPPGEDLDLI
jgi:hypothetical protein